MAADCLTAVEAPTGPRWQTVGVRVGRSRSAVTQTDKCNSIPLFLSLSPSQLHGEAEAHAAQHEELRGSHVSRHTLTSVIRPRRNPIRRRSMPPTLAAPQAAWREKRERETERRGREGWCEAADSQRRQSAANSCAAGRRAEHNGSHRPSC